jgi:hypothetical protein
VVALAACGSSLPDAASDQASDTGGSTKAAGSLPVDPCIAAGTCPAGVWVNVTPTNFDRSDANSVVATSDGTHAIFVAAMWNTGIWRYVEP